MLHHLNFWNSFSISIVCCDSDLAFPERAFCRWTIALNIFYIKQSIEDFTCSAKRFLGKSRDLSCIALQIGQGHSSSYSSWFFKFSTHSPHKLCPQLRMKIGAENGSKQIGQSVSISLLYWWKLLLRICT